THPGRAPVPIPAGAPIPIPAAAPVPIPAGVSLIALGPVPAGVPAAGAPIIDMSGTGKDGPIGPAPAGGPVAGQPVQPGPSGAGAG
ncbi:beta-xylosidase, partial [Mycobacterium ulcerans]